MLTPECRNTFSWTPVTGPVRDILVAQQSLRVKAKAEAVLNKRTAMYVSSVKKRRADIQIQEKDKGESRLEAIRALDKLLKATPHDLQGAGKAQHLSIKRRTSCATEIIAEANTIRPPMPARYSFQNLGTMDGFFAQDKVSAVNNIQVNRVRHPHTCFAMLPVKENTRSLAHYCGFVSFSLTY